MAELDPSNPYAAPVVEATAAETTEQHPEVKQVTLLNALFRWTLICAVSAAPSFVFGFSFANHFLKVPVMVTGVLTFAVAYAYIDISPRWRGWMANQLIRRCILWTYGLRIVVSIIFPVGGVNDLLVGMFSFTTVSALYHGFSDSIEQLTNPVQILLTTLVQGALLNVELFLIALLFIGISRVVRDVRSRREGNVGVDS